MKIFNKNAPKITPHLWAMYPQFHSHLHLFRLELIYPDRFWKETIQEK